MEKNNRQFIAYGLTQDEASAAAHHLINIGCSSEKITITTDPTIIYSLKADEKVNVGVKAHATNQSQWSQLMPICRHMKANGIKFQVIK